MKKSLVFKILYLFLVLIVVAGASVFATNTYLANQVSYGNSNVEDALNDLYKLKGNDENYSTEEKIVGKWIDGKPLYRITYTLKMSNITNSWMCLQDLTNLNIDYLKYTGYVKASNGWLHPLPFSNTALIGYNSSDHNLNEYHTGTEFNGASVYLIIEYTKN